MPRPQRIRNLDDFSLTASILARLGDRPVTFRLQLQGRRVASLLSLRPQARDRSLRSALSKQRAELQRRFPTVRFTQQGRPPAWTQRAVAPAKLVPQIASSPGVKELWIQSIQGRKKTAPKPTPTWFGVWALIATPVEGPQPKMTTVEDRLVIVRAKSEIEARKRASRQITRYSSPGMNTFGYLFREVLIAIRDVYELWDDTIDPNGTEVYWRLRRTRMKPEYRWKSLKSSSSASSRRSS